MKKTILTILVCGVMVLRLTGCGTNKNEFDIGKESNIEIVENKPLARMLYHNVDIGAEIPPELYQAVAEVLAMVYQMRN